MKLITAKSKKFIVGMVWRWTADSEVYSRKEIHHLCDEVGDGGVKKGIVFKPKIDTSGGEKRLLHRTGLGLVVPISSDESDLELKSTRYYSLGQAFCSAFPNAITVIPLDDGTEDWWFCASLLGSVVPDTDFYGSRTDVLTKACEWAQRSVFLYQNIDSPKLVSTSESVFMTVNDSYKEFVYGGSDKSLSFIKLNLGEIIGSSPGLKRIGQIKGVNFKLLMMVGAIVLLLYWGGSSIYSNYLSQYDSTDTVVNSGAPTQAEIAERIRKAKEAQGEKMSEEELAVIKRAEKERLLSDMDRDLREKMFERLIEILSQQDPIWLFKASDLVRSLPYAAHGFVFQEANCDFKQKCEVVWGADDSIIHDNKSMESLLSQWTPKNAVVNGLGLDSISKVFEFNMKSETRFNYLDLEYIPLINFFLNDLMERVYFVHDTGLVSDVRIDKPSFIEVFADTPDGFDGKEEDIASGNFIHGTFKFTVDNDKVLPIVFEKIFSASKFMSIRAMRIVNTNKGYKMVFRGQYVTKKD